MAIVVPVNTRFTEEEATYVVTDSFDGAHPRLRKGERKERPMPRGLIVATALAAGMSVALLLVVGRLAVAAWSCHHHPG